MATTKVDVNLIGASGTPGSGNFLRGDGSWQAVGGAWEFVSTAVASGSANVSITGIDSSADTWVVNIEGVNIATDVATLRMRTSNDTSSHSYDSGSSDYDWGWLGLHSGTDYKATDTSDAEIEIGADPFTHGNDATSAWSGQVFIHAPSNTTYHTLISYQIAMMNDGGVVQLIQGCARRIAAEAVTAVQFYMSSGNFDTGRFTLLKCNHS